MEIKSLKNFYIIMIIGITLLVFTILYVSTLGVANISTIDSFKILISKIYGLKEVVDISGIEKKYILIVTQIRLPRIILAGIVGLGLSIVGCTFQGMFKNPMADPYVLGISSGAALGATIGMFFQNTVNISGMSIINIFAFLGALLTTMIVYNIARVGVKIPSITLLLAGIAVGFFFSSCISVIMIFNHDKIDSIVLWTMGSLSAASWNRIYIVAPIILIGTLIVASYSKELNIMLIGEDDAKSLGINVQKIKKILLIVSSIMVASIVSISGIIGFVGLIIPHVARMIVGPNHKYLIPFTALLGTIFLIICDTLARTIAPPTEIPVGAITSIFGSPYFIYLLYQNKKKVVR